MNRRNEFTTETKRAAHNRSGGICECHRIPNWPFPICGLPLGIGNTFYDHVDPDYFSGCNKLDNCAVLTKTCNTLKTSTIDQPRIAKTKRVSDRARGIGCTLKGRPLTGTRASGIKLRMNGGPVWRDSGRPLGRSSSAKRQL